MTAKKYQQQRLLIELGAPIPEGFTLRFKTYKALERWAYNRQIIAPDTAVADILKLTKPY